METRTVHTKTVHTKTVHTIARGTWHYVQGHNGRTLGRAESGLVNGRAIVDCQDGRRYQCGPLDLEPATRP